DRWIVFCDSDGAPSGNKTNTGNDARIGKGLSGAEPGKVRSGPAFPCDRRCNKDRVRGGRTGGITFGKVVPVKGSACGILQRHSGSEYESAVATNCEAAGRKSNSVRRGTRLCRSTARHCENG